ncbi:MAG: hypothetical protein B6I17_02930 [Tenericutes bacterium 4572_104]|nr:MAG: hypothetical protein B6I17_02930 [Tenericutes bacterium 4572_104]
MKIRVNESPEIEEIEVIINCKKNDLYVKEIKRSLTYLNKVITGKINGRSYTLTPNIIYYFDTIDNKTFAYTKDKIFDVNLRLYQIEEILKDTPIIRINKNTILNTTKIKNFKTSLNGRMEAILLNDERLIISRKYVPNLKRSLGGGK